MESAGILWLKGKLRRFPFFFNLYKNYIGIKRYLFLNPWYLRWGKRNAKYIYKPVLSYLEIDIVSHCNLRCNGCSHFSPVADQWFADVYVYEKDMKRLSALFSNIEAIRFLGGEPLLHPEIEKFMHITREVFRNANIAIATNGFLLYSLKESFWETCRKNQIKLNWSVYPPLFNKENEILKWVQAKGIIIYSDKQEKFRAVLNTKGDSVPSKAFEFCRSTAFVPYLFSGKVYICSRPVVIKSFNKKFGTNIPESGFIDIHDSSINGWDILISISIPGETCRFCITSKYKYPWRESSNTMSDWSIPENVLQCKSQTI